MGWPNQLSFYHYTWLGQGIALGLPGFKDVSATNFFVSKSDWENSKEADLTGNTCIESSP